MTVIYTYLNYLHTNLNYLQKRQLTYTHSTVTASNNNNRCLHTSSIHLNHLLTLTLLHTNWYLQFSFFRCFSLFHSLPLLHPFHILFKCWIFFSRLTEWERVAQLHRLEKRRKSTNKDTHSYPALLFLCWSVSTGIRLPSSYYHFLSILQTFECSGFLVITYSLG